jgi:hypothetical protein
VIGKKNAMDMTADEFHQAVRTIGWREHFAREKAIEDAYLARFLDRNPDLKPKPAEPSEAVVRTHTDIALRLKQDQSAAGQYLRARFPDHADWYARRNGLPTDNASADTPAADMTDEQRQVADAAEAFLKSKGA